MKKVLFIYSPYAGEKGIVSHLDYIIKQYQKKGFVITPFRYTIDDNIDSAVDMLDDSYHHVLTAGGDGTINRIVSALQKRGLSIPIATIPAGTANDFAKMLGFSSSIKKACDQILNGDISEVDLGKANDLYFVNVLSAGLLTEVSQKTPTFLKNTLGKMAYYVSSMQEMPKFKKMHVKVFNETIFFEDNALIVFVFNGKTAGNFPIAHQSSEKDGLLDVLIVKGDNFGESIQTALHFLTGSKRKYPKGVIHFKTENINIEFDIPVSFDVDGEHGPDAPINVQCIKKGLKVIIPKAKTSTEKVKNLFESISEEYIKTIQ